MIDYGSSTGSVIFSYLFSVFSFFLKRKSRQHLLHNWYLTTSFLRAFYAIFQIILQKSNEIGTVAVPISWMRKLSQTEVVNSCQVTHAARRL